ncbi:MAG: ATP-binding protein [Planctomycetota bacterium]|nr:ATP-binding protein [Planctomycetota bacterium]
MGGRAGSPAGRDRRAAGGGGLGENLAVETSGARDEIGDLARAFGSMVESLRRSQEDLLKAERLAATGRLAASMAHEIRNPLTSLRITVQMLADKGQGDANTQEAYAIVLGEIDRLELAVEEMLTYARPRPPQRAPTDLNKLCADTLAFMRRQLEHSKVEARQEADPDLPKNLPLDANKIRQLLVNLILNALQAIVRGGSVTVRTLWSAEARRVRIEVADTGPGIPEAVRAKAFELFVSTKPGGGGMGLAIAKQVVEEHGGTIDFETSGAGTTFRVELPADALSEPLTGRHSPGP